MRVLRSRLSSCSVTLICCLMISAAVMGRRGRKGRGTVCDIGLAAPATGDDGVETTLALAILRDGDLLIIFNPNAFLTLLVGFVTTWFGFPPSLPPPLPSWLE